jgi:voltage-gated potassium channel
MGPPRRLHRVSSHPVNAAGSRFSGSNRSSVWKQLESGRITHRFEPVVLAATVALIPVFLIETESSSTTWKDVAFGVNWLIWAVFAAELAFILTVAPRKRAALRAHWLDALIVVVTAPPFGRFLSSLRLMRLARLLRLLRLTAILTRLIQRERTLSSGTVFRIAAMLTLLVVVIAGAVEALIDTSDFHSTWQGIWWAAVTVTTVGYGDVYPKSVGGQIVAVVVMIFGISFLSILTATIASGFVKTERGDETDAILQAIARVESDLAELRELVRPAEASG